MLAEREKTKIINLNFGCCVIIEAPSSRAIQALKNIHKANTLKLVREEKGLREKRLNWKWNVGKGLLIDFAALRWSFEWECSWNCKNCFELFRVELFPLIFWVLFLIQTVETWKVLRLRGKGGGITRLREKFCKAFRKWKCESSQYLQLFAD
jgi:hypothetical protein